MKGYPYLTGKNLLRGLNLSHPYAARFHDALDHHNLSAQVMAQM